MKQDDNNIKLLKILFEDGSIAITDNNKMLAFLEFLNQETIKQNNKKRGGLI